MAEVDTNMLSREHSDIRHEQAEQAAVIRQQNADRIGEVRYDLAQGINEVVKEGLKGDFNTVDSVNCYTPNTPATKKTVQKKESSIEHIVEQVVSSSANEWCVRGSAGKTYAVTKVGTTYACTCSGFAFRKHCKHVDSIKNRHN